MASRQKLHNQLAEIIGDSKRVYFQPPESIKLTYPCIIYFYEPPKDDYADDRLYKTKDRYTVTIIDRDPDSPYKETIRELKYCSADRPYRADNLYHFVFTIYI